MKGAIVFLIVFVIALGITLADSSIPPGKIIYAELNVPETSYPVLGIPATTLVIAVFNGVIYGVIVWLIFTVFDRGRKSKKEQTIQQTVNVQVPGTGEKSKDVQGKEKEE